MKVYVVTHEGFVQGTVNTVPCTDKNDVIYLAAVSFGI